MICKYMHEVQPKMLHLDLEADSEIDEVLNCFLQLNGTALPRSMSWKFYVN